MTPRCNGQVHDKDDTGRIRIADMVQAMQQDATLFESATVATAEICERLDLDSDGFISW